MRLGQPICQLSKDERNPWNVLTLAVALFCALCAGLVVGCQLALWGLR